MDPNTIQPNVTPPLPVEPANVGAQPAANQPGAVPQPTYATVAQPQPVSMPQPMAANASYQPQLGQTNPGSTLGIVSLVLSFIPFLGLFGLISGIIGKSQSKKAGQSNGLAVAGIIVSVLQLIGIIAMIVLVAFGATQLVHKCQQLGPGTHNENGTTYTCGASSSSSSTTTN